MKILENLKIAAKELILTLSNKGSKLSSKRIERMFLMGSVFTISLGSWVYFMYKGMLTSTDVTVIIIPLLGAAGYSSFRTYTDKKLENNTNDDITTSTT